ncbi:MAG TPA: hypothetical protein VNM36_01920 [Gemmatimonadaceae bacterium]|nr:hypothetical protein [Gemmatimonadaceae bacterium]
MTRFSHALRPLVAAASIVFAVGCNSTYGDDGPTGNTGSIQVTANPSSLSLPQGGSGTITATLARGGGYTGVVTVAVSGLPTGATATVDPAQLSGISLSATITVTIASTVTIGTYAVTVIATGNGVQTRTASFQLAVTVPPSFALSAAPVAGAIAAGGSRAVAITIGRTNFDGPVTLALLNPPAGITGTFDPTPATNTSTLTLTIAASVAPANYALTIQGTAPGLTARTSQLTITVVPAPPSGKNVTYYFCTVDDVPTFFAYQDGAGAWQSATGVSSGGTTTFSFNITQGRGGVLSVYQYSAAAVARVPGRTRGARMNRTTTSASMLRDPLGARRKASGRSSAFTQAAVGDVYETYVLFGSTTELAQDGLDACGQAAEPTKTVRGSVSGIVAGQYAMVSLGSATEIFDGATFTNPVTLHDVLPGLHDLVGSRIATPGAPPDKLIIFRNLNVPDQGSLPSPIDFNGPASLVPATATATISGAAAGDQLEIFVGLLTANRGGQLWSDLAPSPVAARPWAGLNSANMITGDMHHLFAFASRSTGGLANFRVVSKTVGPVSNQALALGAEVPAPAVLAVSGGAYPRYRFQGSLASDYNKRVSLDVVGEEDGSNALYIVTSVAWLTASGTPGAYDVTMPDIAGLPGFPAAARLSAGDNVITLSAHGFTGPGLYEPRPIAGFESKELYKAVRIGVP